MASSSSFSLVPLWSLLVPCILFLLCSVTPHNIELSPFTGFHKKSTLSILWLWWRVTLWSMTFPHPDGAIPPPLPLCNIQKLLSWLHSSVILSHLGLPRYHFLAYLLIKNGFLRQIQFLSKDKFGEHFLPHYKWMSFVTRMSYSVFPVPRTEQMFTCWMRDGGKQKGGKGER